MKEPAGMWLRVSSLGQDEKSQIPDNERWIEAHGYDLRRTYTIHGKSAFKGNRKFDQTWAQVLTDMANGEIRVLIVWKQNRLDRKLNTFRMLQQVPAGCRVEFVTQPHLNDLTTMGGRLALKVEEEIAYAESKNKSDAIRIKQDALRAAKSLVGRPPFGYRVAEVGRIKTLVPTPEGIRYVPEIFQRIADGRTLISTAEWLETEGVKPLIWKAWNKKDPDERGPEPTKWSPKSISQIIRRSTYVGERQDADGMTILEVKPIVDAKLFADANKRLEAAPMRGKRGPSVHEPSLLSGLLECANCGAPIYRVFCGKAPYRKPYYRCHGNMPQPKGCGVSVNGRLADTEINEIMESNFLFVRTTKFVPGNNHEVEIAAVDRELVRLAAKRLPYNEEDAERAKLRAERDRLESLPATEDRWDHPILLENGEPVTHSSKWQASDIDGKRAMLGEYRITFCWDEVDGSRFPRFLMVPKIYQPNTP
jgi:DNA invertase Pin-like site-specific DNA recombinase